MSKVGVAKVISGVDMTSDDLGSVVNAGLGDDLKLDLVINNAGMLMHETCVHGLRVCRAAGCTPPSHACTLTR